MKRLLSVIFLITILTLVGCSANNAEKQQESGQSTEQNKPNSEGKKENYTPLSDEEIYAIVKGNYEQIEIRMQKLQKQHGEWEGADWIVAFDLSNEETKEAYDIVRKELEGFVANEYMQVVVHGMLVDYFKYFIPGSPFFVDKLNDFQVVKQDEMSFQVQYSTEADEAGYSSTGTYTVDFIKVANNWVIQASEFVTEDEGQTSEMGSNDTLNAQLVIDNNASFDDSDQLVRLTFDIFKAQNDKNYEFLRAVLSSGSSLNEENDIFTFENTRYPHEQEFLTEANAKNLEHRYTNPVDEETVNVGFASIDYEKEYSYVIELEYIIENGKWKLNDMDINK